MSAVFSVPAPVNETVRSYAPGSPERTELLSTLQTMAAENTDVPVFCGRERVRTGEAVPVVMPHCHAKRIGSARQARAEDVQRAIDAALKVAPEWQRMPFEHRASIFLKAAELLAGPWRQRINAACMLGQSKTCLQSEIDAVCELIDFFKFGVHYARTLMEHQPISGPSMWNRVEPRPLEGFVFAITPFNFLSIGVNLAAAPALMGNVVLCKPAHATTVGMWHCMEMLREAGLPDGVISLIPGDGPTQGKVALESEHLAGIHFTGSTRTFHALNRTVAERLDRYRNMPRLVGETGGKDFIVAHPSADVAALVAAIVRGGYEYQGQKCSAPSRIYVPASLWREVSERLVGEIKTIKVGDVSDFTNFMGAVIDERAFEKIDGYLTLAKSTARVLAGGKGDKSKGYFVEPTLVQVEDPKHRLMQEEIFGPVVTCWVYEDSKWSEMLDLVNSTSPYGLTGAVFSTNRHAAIEAMDRLRHAAGNFYINDKPTGAVVGQQPFGGSRASGTNDKAGSMWNLSRWVSLRTVKENFLPPTDYRYPYLGKN